MLKFFRKNKMNIMMFIIISFVVTTLFGVIFYNQSFSDQQINNESINEINRSIAKIGDDLFVSNQAYQLEIQRLQAQIPTSQPVTSALITQVQLQALSNAVNARLLLESAEMNDVQVTKKDIESFILPVYDQYQVSTKKELKKALKNTGGNYAELIEQLEDNIKINKMNASILSQVKLSKEDLDMINQTFTIRIMFFSNIASDNTVIPADSLKQDVQSIRSKISDSASFIAVMSEYQSTPNSTIRVYPDPITLHSMQLLPEIARIIRVLQPNEISSPIQYMGGYAIVELIEQGELSDGQEVTTETFLESWQNLVKHTVLTYVRKNRPVEILDLPLKAVHLLNGRQFDEAIQVYQQLSSQDPSNPIPHLYIAQVYLAINNLASAKQEALKAEIKASILTESMMIPEIHFLLASIYEKEGLFKKQMQQYDIILDRSEDISVLKKLTSTFNDDTQRLEKLNKKIDALEARNDRKELESAINQTPLDLSVDE